MIYYEEIAIQCEKYTKCLDEVSRKNLRRMPCDKCETGKAIKPLKKPLMNTYLTPETVTVMPEIIETTERTPIMALEDAVRENAELGAAIIKQYFLDKNGDDELIKTAMMAITQYNKTMMTNCQIVNTKINLGKAVYDNKEEMKAFIQSNISWYGETKKIEAK
jgi:hypothetical protein